MIREELKACGKLLKQKKDRVVTAKGGFEPPFVNV